MTGIIYLLTILYATYAIGEVIGGKYIFIYSAFLILMFLISIRV